ncbi:hypothetical protein [Treponema endosymbiont of Eucomonympha sp.]|uniref:hypothetical protein n=1 Tax=Treponema endosymbiont of Eucomonympha sp. TaxID=1580831 RepID=UPI000B094558|nr:hypothetical protein [Treponema endosymbiont of Eucomonympha sp.]
MKTRGTMHHKTCVLMLLFLFRIIGAAGAERIVSTFESLKSAERLAYSAGEEGRRMSLYAQDSRSLKTTRLLGSWDGVTEWGGIQFAKDRKVCFFLKDTPEEGRESLYKVDGNMGTVALLLGHISYNSRVSSDGRFFLFNNIHTGGARANSRGGWSYLSTDRGVFFLVSAEDGKLLDVFDWKVKRDFGGGFDILRDAAGMFRIQYGGEGGIIGAIATLDPRTRTFAVLWDLTDDKPTAYPESRDAAYQDDVDKQPYDPTLRLKDS